MAFSAKPASQSEDAKKWIADAAVGSAKAKDPSTAPALNPKSPPTKAFNLRLNEYELSLLRKVAEAQFCSQQAVAKQILVRALEQAVSELK